jgi:hypothetical protein
MKKLVGVFALCVFVSAGLTGCGGDAPAPKKDDKKGAAPAAPTGGKETPKEAPKK